MATGLRALFLDEDDARRAAGDLRRDGFEASCRRDRFAGEDDDEDQPWALVTDAPAGLLELVAERHDGWVDEEVPPPSAAPLRLPASPIRAHRVDGGPT